MTTIESAFEVVCISGSVTTTVSKHATIELAREECERLNIEERQDGHYYRVWDCAKSAWAGK